MRKELMIAVIFALSFSRIASAGGLRASWYSEESLRREGTWARSGGVMADGGRFDERAMTCATRLYPLGSWVVVTNLENGKSVEVRVTDRIGKRFAETRIDLSKAAFIRIADLRRGTVGISSRKGER